MKRNIDYDIHNFIHSEALFIHSIDLDRQTDKASKRVNTFENFRHVFLIIAFIYYHISPTNIVFNLRIVFHQAKFR